MPLPFLQDKKTIASVIMAKRKPDGSTEETGTEGDIGIESCMDEFKRAMTTGDSKAMAQAFKDAFDILESSPHEENDEQNQEDNSFDAQNEKAVS